ncbi:putative like-Sm (LSM) domain containing protein, LSm4/SmD1/SmD3 [Helianthus debilis subsp. tardiflorus]
MRCDIAFYKFHLFLVSLSWLWFLELGVSLEAASLSPGIELVELKNGETYNGHLVNCDTWMNIHLREVICTSKDGDRFWRMPECYIRGNTIKYLRVPDEVFSTFVNDCHYQLIYRLVLTHLIFKNSYMMDHSVFSRK